MPTEKKHGEEDKTIPALFPRPPAANVPRCTGREWRGCSCGLRGGPATGTKPPSSTSGVTTTSGVSLLSLPLSTWSEGVCQVWHQRGPNRRERDLPASCSAPNRESPPGFARRQERLPPKREPGRDGGLWAAGEARRGGGGSGAALRGSERFDCPTFRFGTGRLRASEEALLYPRAWGVT